MFIGDVSFKPSGCEQCFEVIKAAPWESDMVGMVLGATNDTGLVPDRPARGLRFLVSRVPKRRKPDDEINQWRWSFGF